VVAAGVYGPDPLQIFDPETLQRIVPEATHRTSVYGIHVDSGAGAAMMATCSYDGSFSLWDLRAPQGPRMQVDDPYDDPLYSVYYDGGWRVWVGTARWGAVRSWDLRNRRFVNHFLSPKESSPAYSLAVMDDVACVGLASGVAALSPPFF